MVDLRDKYGITRLGFEQFEGDLAILKKCYIESVIKIEGVVNARPQSANDEMATGAVEVQVKNLEIISEVDPNAIPFLPHGKIEAKEDTRLKYRYLDLEQTSFKIFLALEVKPTKERASFYTRTSS